MTAADRLLDRAADRLEQLARRSANGNGLAAKLIAPLADDADLLRKLKPSLIAARAKGERPAADGGATRPAAPSGPQLGARTEPKSKRPKRPKPPDGGGPNPFLVVAAAVAVGVLAAKWVDWRGHAHPRT
jgi:hypothetical protein